MRQVRIRVAVLVGLALAIALITIGTGTSNASLGLGTVLRAPVDPDLTATAAANPSARLRVIVQGRQPAETIAGIVGEVPGATLRRQLSIIDGVAADIPATALQLLASNEAVRAISLDGRVVGSGGALGPANIWPQVVGADTFTALGLPTPAIALVDSGVDESRLEDFGARVIAQVNLSSREPAATGDQYGHGTMVAGIAAGSSSSYPGAAPLSDIVSIRTADSNDESLVSDVVAAAQWLLENKDAYGVRVVNLSLLSGQPSSFVNDPLDQALEQLWFNGVVVVAAAGNLGGPMRMDYAPASDPFIIVVGATDTLGTLDTADDAVASFSSYGRGWDGFARPDLVAPGRAMIAPSPEASALTAKFPASVVAPGYLRLSGTSFAAPVVAGAAAQLLALHPDWTPDQVKGALMQTTRGVAPDTPLGAAGAGELDAAAAAAAESPINPNAALQPYLLMDASGKTRFDAEAWSHAVQRDPNGWAAAAASGSAWGSYAWGSAWGSVLWAADTDVAGASGAAWGSAWEVHGAPRGAARGARPGEASRGAPPGAARGDQRGARPREISR